MNFKKTAIALAIASVAAAPIVASADGVYASARIGFESTSDGSTSASQLRNFASRLGFKSETELGNGWSGWGKYELGVNTDTSGSGTSLRHAVVGLKDDTSNIFLGQTYHTFYTHIVGVTDAPWWNSGIARTYSPGRSDSAITYDGRFGPVRLGVTATLDSNGSTNTSSALDSYDLGLTFDLASNASLGFAVHDQQDSGSSDPSPVLGTALSISDLGGASVGLHLQSQDWAGSTTTTSYEAHVGVSDFYVHVESIDYDGRAENKSGLTLGYTLSLGPRTLIWFEASQTDNKTSTDTSVVHAALKYDIL